MKIKIASLHFSLFLTLVMALPAYSAPPAYNLQVGVGNEDNGFSDESFQQLTGSVRYGKGLTRRSAINLNADISTRRFADTSSKDENSLLLEAIYNYIPTPGYTKPVYSVALRQEFEQFDNSANDTSKTSIILVDSFRINDQLSFIGGIEFIDLSSDLIDSSISGIFVGLDLWTTDNLLFYSNLKFQSEENTINAAATSPRPASRDEIAGSHLPTEPGFSGGVGGSTPTSGASSDSDNRFITLGVNYSIDSKQSVDFSVERFNYETTSTTTIDQISLDYFFKF